MSAVAAIPSRGSERQKRKALAESLLQAALRAVDPVEAMRRAVRREDGTLVVADRAYRLHDYGRVIVIGAGKAAAKMAQAAESILGDDLTSGIALTKYGYGAPTSRIQVVEAGHPIPDENGLAAAKRVATLLDTTTSDDLVLCLISGGASALLTLPAPPITLEDKRVVTDILLRSGATINELNTLRKHLSAIKGGGLVRFAPRATIVSFILSDVVGNPLDVIASGPTVGDTTTYADAYAVLTKYGVLGAMPSTVIQRLRAGTAGELPETPKPGERLFEHTQNVVIGSNELAAKAALAAARDIGWHTLLLSTFLEGEASAAGVLCAAIAKEMANSGHPVARPGLVVAGGETTVTVRGSGRGGRNQELVLAASLHLANWPGIAVMSFATDGGDGQTDAAGAYADGETVARASAAGREAALDLSNNDSYELFAAIGDLIVTGPTSTNVNDLTFVMAY